MSNTFTNRHGRKYGLHVGGFDKIYPMYATKKEAYNWDNPIWRRERIKMLRRGHQMRERLEDDPKYWENRFKKQYSHWDFRTDEDKRYDWTVGQR